MFLLIQPTDKCPSYLVSYRSILGELDGVLLRELTALPPPPGAGRDATVPIAGGRAFNLLAYVAKATGWNERLLPSNLVTIATDNVVCLQAHGLPVPPLLLHALPLLRNYTSQIYFHKFSPLHVRRAWDLDQGHPYTLADEATPAGQPADAMDPRGTVGGLLVRHLVHHWENKLAAQRELRTDPASLAAAVDPSVDAFVEKLGVASRAAAAAAAESSHTDGALEAEEALANTPAPTPTSFVEAETSVRARVNGRVGGRSGGHGRGHVATSIHIRKEETEAETEAEAEADPSASEHTPEHESEAQAHAGAAPAEDAEEEYAGPFAPPPPGAPSGPGSASLARRLRLRNKHHNSAAIARTAGEKLMVYSAHDSTIIALMQSLGLITAPDSEYLLPPYAASVTFELRHKAAPSGDTGPLSGYFVNAYYGFPQRVEGGPQHADTADAWEYHRHPIALRCPPDEADRDAQAEAAAAGGPSEKGSRKERPAWRARKKWQCPLSAFQRYVLLSARSSLMDAADGRAPAVRPPRHVANQVYAADDGCCVRTGAFHALGCDATGTHTTRGGGGVELENECVAFRARCPATACAEGFILDPLTFACVRVSTRGSKNKNQQPADGGAAEGAWGVGPGRPRPDDLVIPIPSPVGLPVDPELAGQGQGQGGADGVAAGPHVQEAHVEWLLLLLGLVCMVGGFGGGVCYARMGGRFGAIGSGGKAARGSPVSYDYSVNGAMEEEDRQSLLNGGGGGGSFSQSRRKSASGSLLA